jgi:hypothetical protein
MPRQAAAPVAEVYAELIDVRVQLHQVAGVYRVLFVGLGWHPQSLGRDRDAALARVLGMHSYGPAELEMVRQAIRVNP